MKRSISNVALLFTSISAIIGSGWLFAAYYTSSIAGPSALISWVIGGACVGFIAFVFAELSSMLPVMGSSSRISQYTHGTLVSFSFSWIIWLAYVALSATEVQAVVQYLSYYFPSFINTNGGLTSDGYIIAAVLMLGVTALNVFSLEWLIRCNNALTVMKIIIPIFISIVLLIAFAHSHETVPLSHKDVFPFGFHGMLGAISTGGIVFAFNGFKQACELAGEAQNPNKALPIAVVGSVFICLIIYLLLQAAFLLSLNSGNLIQGWKNINLPGAHSPFAAIIAQNHLHHLLPILYIGAIIGPLAAGLMYASSAGRSLYAMSHNDYLPSIFRIHNKKGIPWMGLIVSSAVGMCLFAPLPGWNRMISFLASLMAISYAIAPISMYTLRKQAPDQHRPLKLPLGRSWAVIAFYMCNMLSYWSGWEIISKLGISMLIGFIILFFYNLFTRKEKKINLHGYEAIWIWPYFIGLSLISYLGNFGGGLGVISFGLDFLVIFIFSVVIIMLADYFKLAPQTTQAYIDELQMHLGK